MTFLGVVLICNQLANFCTVSTSPVVFTDENACHIQAVHVVEQLKRNFKSQPDYDFLTFTPYCLQTVVGQNT